MSSPFASPSIKNTIQSEELTLPTELLPQCWKDEARVNALFAPFRVKTVNPEEFQSKFKFWKGLVKQWCEYKGSSGFTINELNQVFKKNGRAPACLQTVVQEMVNESEVVPENEFMQPPQHTWTGWAVNTFVRRPVRWSFDKLKQSVVSTPPVDKGTKYVIKETAKTHGESLMAALADECSDICSPELLSLSEVLNHCSTLNISPEGAQLALHQLYCEGKLTLATVPDRNMKMSGTNDTVIKISGTNSKCTPISEVDIGIYSLKQNERFLVESIDKLEEEKEALRIEAKSYLERNKRQLAKNCLKRKRVLDNCIERRSGTLDNVQSLLERVKESRSDGKVLDSYKSGLAALKNTLKDLQVSPDSVQGTMDGIQEALEDHDEIQAGLGKSFAAEAEEDLESELQDLLSETNEDSNVPILTKIPVPTNSHKDVAMRDTVTANNDQRNKVVAEKFELDSKIRDINMRIDKRETGRVPPQATNVKAYFVSPQSYVEEASRISHKPLQVETTHVDNLLQALPTIPTHLSPKKQAIAMAEKSFLKIDKKNNNSAVAKEPSLYPKLRFDDFNVDDDNLNLDELDDLIDDITTDAMKKNVNQALEERLSKLRMAEK